MSAIEKTFLIVEPKLEYRELIGGFLKTFGFSRLYFANRQSEALELLNAHSIDCIISEWDTPGASGYTLLKLLRGQDCARKIVFILTSQSTAFEKDKLIQAASLKIDGYLLKPFSSSALEKILQEKMDFVKPETTS